MRHLKFLFLLSFLGLASNATAQFIFQNLGEADGLDSKDLLSLYKDQDDFLWIGSINGLNRYDGNSIRPFDNTGQGKNIFINSIFPIDNGDNLLLATSRGLLTFNKRKAKYIADTRFALLSKKNILALKKDGYDRLWILCNSEIFIYDGRKLLSLEEEFPMALKILKQPLSYAAGNAFCWDQKQGGFWIGGLQCFFLDCKNKVLYDSTNNPRQYPLLKKHWVTAIALDTSSNLWYASTSDLSLNYWNKQTNQVTIHRQFEGKKATDGCNYIYVDRKNRLWVSTWMYAAYIKEEGAPIKKIPYSQDSPNSISYGYFRDVVEDREGNLWFATINGVSKLSGSIPFKAIYKLPSYDSFLETNFTHANSILVDKDHIYASKEDGMIAYNMNRRLFKRYYVSSTDVLKNRFLMTVKVGKTCWLAGSHGVFSVNEGEEVLSQLEKAPPSPTNFIFTDNKGKIWFHVMNDAIYRYDPASDRLDRFDGKNEQYGIFKYANCQSFLVLKSGDILFGMWGTGFLKFEASKSRFSVIPVANPKNFHVQQAIEDSDGNVWASIWEKGLYKISQQGNILDSLSDEDGLPFNRIASITMDARGAIWAAGSGGLLFFFTKTKKITRVQINLGKTLQDYWNFVYATKDRIYAVMLDHVVEIDPFKFAKISVRKSPHITSVRIFGNEIETAAGKLLELHPQDNYITFQYASLSHRDVPSLQYSYKLEGIDDDWVEAGRAMTVSYNSLKPGYYNFKVRSTNENEQWMTEVTTLKIRVLPHWWQTWWFFVLAGTLSAVFIDATYRGYLNRKQKTSYDKTIAYFANSVYGENSVNEICWDIARNCISQLHFEDCVVYLWDEGRQKLIQKATYGTKNVREHEILNPMELDLGEGIVGAAAATKKTVIVKDTRKDSRYIVDDEPRLSEIAVPILHEGKVIGVIDSEHSQKKFFNEEHARVLSTIASISANKIAEAQAEEQAQQKEIMLLEINKMLAESQLMALRAQMNPHFVFNCLNSIQECIVTQKYGEASKYLNKFSKLFRRVLNNSDKNLVTIEDENDVLELYLELEQMRFEQSFSYEITVDNDLEAEDIMLPSMLLQPYVENALWHGLMHKDGDRQLIIRYERINDDVFRCLIDDNGIGRKRSLEIKEFNSKGKRHKSKGLQIAKDRLDLLEKQGQHALVQITDKYDLQGNAQGTLVTIELSTFLNNT
ncbi:histidine kinase [Dyadobacter aurulentus]|uniref:histidine kinase n=1 Tax=Dyadobacter sp. UC 10 TaxID=2605428 RepID=UPI0011F170D0|nr:histidine kinase [Dyadobacter sp. UC 10]KAA0993806.1 GAF domain-containing protein [Dyadobacter sp. UC 10]